ncbi:hypothetical protein [Reyranella sp.]|uniref:hypothetical protein n=1 Tax=Reyranella sp. TaxID=1929291 RepID=UPI003BACC986
MRIPYGTIVLLLVAAFLYVGMTANLTGLRGTDAAGRGMAMGFAAVIGFLLWLVLAGLFVLAWFNGRLPFWAAAAVVILLPLSAVAAAVATTYAGERGRWLMAAPFLLPPLLALYALWARLPAAHGVLPPAATGAVLGGAILLLTAVPLAIGWIETMPNPERDAARAEQQRRYEEDMARRGREAAEAEEARFVKLGPDSPLAEWLDFLAPGSSYFERALQGARAVTSRNRDAATLLREGRLPELETLWQLDLDAAAVCEAYAGALQAQAAKIDRTREAYVTEALEIEYQLDNMKWLVRAGCDLDRSLATLEARIRAIADNARLTGIADTVAALRQPR